MLHTHFLKILFRLAATAILAAGLFLSPRAGFAGSLIIDVDTTTDSAGASYQECTPAPGDCSLRGAISKANADLGNVYTIQLEPGATYGLNVTGPGDVDNLSGDLNIRASMTIDGRGATIDGLGYDRVMHILSGDVTLVDLTITNGHARDGSLVPSVFPEGGGGLYITTPVAVRLINCQILNNRAGNGRPGSGGEPAGAGAATPGGNAGSGAAGGGIYATSGVALVLDGVLIEGNEAGTGGTGGAGGNGNDLFPAAAGGGGGSGGAGGGVYVANATQLHMTTTTVRNNRAGRGGPGGPGGHGGDNPAGNGTSGGAGGNGGWGGRAGGLYASLVDAQKSLFYNNTAGNSGDGGNGGAGGLGGAGRGGNGGAGGNAGVLAGSGGGMEHAFTNNAGLNRMTNITIYGNQAGRAGAGGLGGQPGSGTTGAGDLGANGAAAYDGDGGGLYNSGSQALYLDFVTLTQNTGRIGAGVMNAGALNAKNSIFASNQNFAGGTGLDISSNNVSTPYTSDGYNLYSTYPVGRAVSDVVSSNPEELGLLALADNSGPTWTAALTVTSLARGLAECTDRDGLPVMNDQRGFLRPDRNGLCDAGAYQFQILLLPRAYFPFVISPE